MARPELCVPGVKQRTRSSDGSSLAEKAGSTVWIPFVETSLLDTNRIPHKMGKQTAAISDCEGNGVRRDNIFRNDGDLTLAAQKQHSALSTTYHQDPDSK